MATFDHAGAEYDRALSATCAGLREPWRSTAYRDGSLTWTLFADRRRAMPEQGWKIHIAASFADCGRLFAGVVPFLLAQSSSFKMPAAAEHVLKINSGRAGEALIGKIVTVYPADDGEVASLAAGLDRLWASDVAPQIRTDLQIRAASSIYIRFGAFRSTAVMQDAFGRLHSALRRPDGVLVADERRLDGAQPPWAPPPIPGARPVRPLAGRRLTVCGQRYAVLGTLQTAAKGQTLLAANEEMHTRVVKVARRGVGEEAAGGDWCARLRREADFLRFLAAREFKCPRVHAVADCAIVLQDIDGVPLDELPRVRLGAAFLNLVDTVAALHRLGIVHRDLKLSNALLARKHIYLLDFELAAFAGATDAPRCGTQGHMAPERSTVPVSPACDVYALGASLAHAALGLNPGTLAAGPDCLPALLTASGQTPIARIVAAAMNPDPDRRPSAGELYKRLAALPDGWPIAYAQFRLPRRDRSARITHLRGRNIMAAARRCAVLANDLPPTGAALAKGRANQPPGDTIGSGLAGIIVGLAAIDCTARRPRFDGVILAAAERLAGTQQAGTSLGLFTGEAGVALALALVGNKYARRDLLANARQRFTAAADHIVETDLFSGAAGIVWSACLLAAALRTDWPLQSAQQAANALRKSARPRERLLVWPSSAVAAGDAYLGAAHGSAGIAMSLGVWGWRTGCAHSVALSREAFLRLYDHGRTSDKRQLRYQLKSQAGASGGTWCHGSAGYLWSMLQAFGDDRELRKPINWSMQALTDCPVLDNAGYCHGMAGQVELWITLARVRRFSTIARRRAALAVRLMEHLGGSIDNSWSWPGEQGPDDDPSRLRPDLWTGMLGPACATALWQQGRYETLFSPNTLARAFKARGQIIEP